ncbi:MAG: hypothetical protein NT157_05820 [Candidatus Micrarchaeota archaeon]|nr:hypothetical protein [Candidatus Micrarchaeota archaeon]
MDGKEAPVPVVDQVGLRDMLVNVFNPAEHRDRITMTISSEAIAPIVHKRAVDKEIKENKMEIAKYEGYIRKQEVEGVKEIPGPGYSTKELPSLDECKQGIANLEQRNKDILSGKEMPKNTKEYQVVFRNETSGTQVRAIISRKDLGDFMRGKAIKDFGELNPLNLRDVVDTWKTPAREFFQGKLWLEPGSVLPKRSNIKPWVIEWAVNIQGKEKRLDFLADNNPKTSRVAGVIIPKKTDDRRAVRTF